MASTSKGKKAAARALNALEISIHKKVLSCPKQIAQQEDIDVIDAPQDARVAAVNFLLETGYMKLMRFERTKKLAYKAVRVKEAQNMGLLGDDVQMVLARIEEAGNEGIWTKTIQRKTELPQTVVNKCIKTLESQGIIKNIKAVKTPTRKMYMMAFLEPSVEVTGGPWYTDSEFDSAFVSILLDQFYNYIAARSLPEPTSKCARPLFAPDAGPQYPTSTDITQWVKRTQLSSVELTQGHVETLLKVLEYDGRIERLPASTAAMFASALNASKRENEDDSKGKKVKKRKRGPDDSDVGRERKRRKKSKRRSATITSDEESSSDERSVRGKSRSKKDEKGRSKPRRDGDTGTSDSEDDRKGRRRKRRKRDSSSDEESTDDRRSKRKRGRSKSSKNRSISDSDDSEADDEISRARSWSSKKSKSRSTYSHSRSESPKLVEMDAIEAHVYRAIRPRNHNQVASANLPRGREMGVEDMAWAQAPCVKCPQAGFCKEGGPVNASSCEYFPEWMDPVGFGRVPYVDEVGGETDVKSRLQFSVDLSLTLKCPRLSLYILLNQIGHFDNAPPEDAILSTLLRKIPLTQYLQGATEFPFSLLIPQSEVEKFLESKLNALGLEVHREMRLTGMEANGAGRIRLTFENGEVVQATYVVAADGSRSTVRELAGISFNNPFNGESYHIPHQEAIEKEARYLILADILLEGSYPSTFLRESLTITMHPSGAFFLVPHPLPDDIEPSNPKNLTFWRVVFDTTIKYELPPAQPDLAYIQEAFNKRRDIWEEKDLPKVAEVRAASRYRAREAMAGTAYKPFGAGYILLAGDAAHVHSPAGGQGMNLGICDAITLGHILSEHIKNGARDTHLLEEYNKKRQTVAKEVIDFATKSLDRVGTISAMPDFARHLIGSIIDHLGFVKKNTAMQLSGLVNRVYD